MRKKVPQLVHSAAHWRIIWYMLQIEGLVKWKKTPAKGIFLNLSQKPRNWFKDRNHMIMEINVCFVFNWELCSKKLDSSKLENWLTQSKMCKCETEDNSGIYIYICAWVEEDLESGRRHLPRNFISCHKNRRN